MSAAKHNGAAALVAILKWHLPAGNQRKLEALAGEVWAKALTGDFCSLLTITETAAWKVADFIEAEGVKLSKREKKDIANSIMTALLAEAAERSQRDMKPRPHLFKVAPVDDFDR